MNKSFLIAALAAAGLAASAQAAAVTYTATGRAQADLDLTGTTLTVKLTNLTPNASTDAASDLLVGLSLVPSISGAGYTLTGQTAAESFHFTSTTDGNFAGALSTLHWALTSSPNGLYFNGFGTGGTPIIGEVSGGATEYPNAGASLTSGPHGDYAYKTATFTLTVPVSFSLTAITSANFLFNTDGSIVVPGTPGGGGGTGRDVPLPAAAWSGLALLGGLGVAKLRKRV